MKSYKELMVPEDAWGEIQSLVSEAVNPITIVSCSIDDGRKTLEHLQVTNRSYLGAIALECGGILVDYGWLKILGAGNERLSGSLATWNSPIQNILVVAYDLVGGFFAIHSNFKTVFYMAPDTLEWEDTECTYSEFIGWALNGDLQLFYKTMRWDSWIVDSQTIQGDQAFSIFPYLWTAEGQNIEQASKKPVSVLELYELHQEMGKSLNTLSQP
ncbi:DUF2625 family protein [Paenibacillus sp. Leaf72]|uniref:DUF2625 family protein n=1 Tax=Paenibacillus sp. Leaf72 TaxID=1736234 RepID=UPI0006FF6EDF|nr:DUF2625 family protein [Paenibacillus sp. Leaf72]KQO18017.1 hypothetical protein ASF12_05045 [Paenibacillus sp. Leaf72]